MPDLTFTFGPFRLVPAQRALFQDGRPVRLGSRSLELLIVLVQRAGDVVANGDLLAQVWPNLHVEDGSLRVHIAALRRILGDGRAGLRYIANVPGRGYSFVAPVSRNDAPPSAPAATDARADSSTPLVLTSVIGRADIISTLTAQLQKRRFLSIVGPGGIGKTTVARAIADGLTPVYPDGVWFVALSGLSDLRHVPGAVIAVLRHAPFGSTDLPSLVANLRGKRTLIVLDNCEHVVDGAAELAETLLNAAPGVHIVATSREPLRADGEWVQRLPSLALPPTSGALSAAEALAFPAVQLFTERAMASMDEFELENDDVETVVEICRRLDGIPLAIELAAVRAAALGVRQVAAHLDDRFALLTRGRRTAMPRHQTLRAALDWSYDLLPETEAAVLRRLAVFTGDFSMDAASAVAGDLAGPVVLDHIANLAAKSLISPDLSGEHPRYRLLDTTRLYALEKLRGGGEHQGAARRHAEYYRDLLADAEAESESISQADWLATYGRHIDNVRIGIDWAFSSTGDPAIGVALTIAAVPLWVELSLLNECRERAERALSGLGDDPATAPARMKLSAALGWSLMYGVGRAREASAAWATTLDLADRLDDRSYRLRALWSLCIDQFNNGEFRRALEFAQRFASVASGSADVVDLMMADRILATARHYLGEQVDARRHIDQVIARFATVAQQPHNVRFRFDLRVSTHYFQARILWLQGLADQAMRVIEQNIEEGRIVGHALTFCSVLGQGACPIAFLAGDVEAAARYGAMLLEHTERHPLRLWQIWARCFDGMVTAKRGDLPAGLARLQRALEEAGEAASLPRFLLPIGALAMLLGEAGEAAEGLAVADAALTRCKARDEGWYFAELLRIKGELLAADTAERSASAAEDCFDSALVLARKQGALVWELRGALSFARLRIRQARKQDARRILAPVYEKFTEGFQTVDLRAARALLDSLPVD
jgi:predicted ATPase/DNA-binding winged helix-turn-helix (wHTH) protein